MSVSIVGSPSSPPLNYFPQFKEAVDKNPLPEVKAVPNLVTELAISSNKQQQEKLAQILKGIVLFASETNMQKRRAEQELAHAVEQVSITGALYRDLHIKCVQLAQKNEDLKRDSEALRLENRAFVSRQAELEMRQAAIAAEREAFQKESLDAQKKQELKAQEQIRILQAEIGRLTIDQSRLAELEGKERELKQLKEKQAVLNEPKWQSCLLGVVKVVNSVLPIPLEVLYDETKVR